MAQKNASEEQLSGFYSSFKKEHGLTLEALATSYEAKIEARFNITETRIQEIETRIQEAERKLSIFWELLRPLRWLKRTLQKIIKIN